MQMVHARITHMKRTATNCMQFQPKKKIIHTQKQEHGDLANDIEIRQYKKLKKKL